MKFFAFLVFLLVPSLTLAQTPDSVWRPLTVMSVAAPASYASAPNELTNNQAAIQSAIDALPNSGGIVWFDCGVWRKDGLLTITKSHVKFWAAGCASLFEHTNNTNNVTAVRFSGVTGGGVFGLKIYSDGSQRKFDQRDAALHVVGATGPFEIEFNDISGAAQDGIFVDSSDGVYISNNYVHETWADHIHHNTGTQHSYVWSNKFFNQAPSLGDDGVACVTYGKSSTRCGQMEWWNNLVLHTGGGRGFSVIGGNSISIHDNTVYGTAAAGIIVASEPSYDSAGSDGITITNNRVYATAQVVTSHSGILISAANAGTTIANVTSTNNVSYGNGNGSYRQETYNGAVLSNVTSSGTVTSEVDGPPALPNVSTPTGAAILRTRDVSHVASPYQAGLYRIHVRRNGSVFEQRFEYIVKSSDSAKLAAWCAQVSPTGIYVSDRRVSSGTAYALVLSPVPLDLASGVSGVSFSELRAVALSWLWDRVDAGDY